MSSDRLSTASKGRASHTVLQSIVRRCGSSTMDVVGRGEGVQCEHPMIAHRGVHISEIASHVHRDVLC